MLCVTAAPHLLRAQHRLCKLRLDARHVPQVDAVGSDADHLVNHRLQAGTRDGSTLLPGQAALAPSRHGAALLAHAGLQAHS